MDADDKRPAGSGERPEGGYERPPGSGEHPEGGYERPESLNRRPAGLEKSANGLDALPTPCLLVDAARLRRNLEGMAALAAETGTRLVPHAKSHKSPELAARQLAGGAAGLCTAKVSEAAVFAEAGVASLLVAYPMVGSRATALAELAVRHPGTRFGAAVDSERGLEDLVRATATRNTTIDLWLEVDTGLRRSGLDPRDPALVDLAHRAREAKALRLTGLLTHAGHAYKAAPSEIPAIGRAEGETMVAAARALEKAGLGPLRVSLGSTPTLPYSARVEGVDEIHPGVYVFGDRQQVNLGAMRPDDVALTVLATCVSHPAPGRWVLDAGSKTLSSDRGAHGSESITGYGRLLDVSRHPAPDPDLPLPFVSFGQGLQAESARHRSFGNGLQAESSRREGPTTAARGRQGPPHRPAPVLTRLSEEHGVVEFDGDLDLAPGDRVEIVPNHACAAVNLAERLVLTEGEGSRRTVTAIWPVSARAMTE